MNWDYARHAFLILGLSGLLGLLLWSVGFGIYLNRIGSHGWASTRRLLRTLPGAALGVAILCSAFWEDRVVPQWLLAHAGLASARMAMAGRYTVGDRLLRRNPAMARAWVTRAAGAGSAEAKLVLAGMDMEGRDRTPDPAAALVWARGAAAQGLVDATLLIGEILAGYPHLAQPGETAQAYFDAALPRVEAQARAGNAQAMFSLGMLKIRGEGLPKDQASGFALLLAAQDKGIPMHQAFVLGVIRGKLPPAVIQRAEASRRQGISISH